jgi:hypothetical protein
MKVLFYFTAELGIKPKASCMQNKCSMQLPPSPVIVKVFAASNKCQTSALLRGNLKIHYHIIVISVPNGI